MKIKSRSNFPDNYFTRAGDFVLLSPVSLFLRPGEVRKLDMELDIIPDEKEGFYVRVFPDLFTKKRIMLMTYDILIDRGVSRFFIVLHNSVVSEANPILHLTSGTSINVDEPVVILSPYLRL